MTDSNSGRSDDPYSSGPANSGDSPWSQNWSSDPQPNPGSASSSSSASDWPGYPSSASSAPQPQQPYGQPTSQPSAADPYGQQPYPQTPSYGENQYGANQYGSNPYETTPYQGGAAYPYGYAAVAPNHPQAVTAMVLGIVGLVVCPFVGIAGFVLGGRARREIDAAPGQYSGRGMATAGWVLGIVSIAYSALLVLGILFAVIGGLASSGS